LVLVTHDRYLLDTVSDQLLALDGAGGATYYADFAQYQAARSAPPRPAVKPGGGLSSAPRTSAGKPVRLTYLEQREWETIEQRILAAEASCAAAQQAADDPAIVSDATELQLRLAAVETARAEVDALYSRWAELDAKRS
jgi:ATP-binding cassette subfamily F protein uup